MRGITKRFPGVVANDGVTLELRAGEVHALLGENGAGKTTLISMLYGLYPPDEGEIVLGGKSVRFRSPRDAIAAGIGLVAQHFLLVKRHTVAENIALGLEGTPLVFPLRDLKGRIRAFGERYGLKVDPDARVGELSPGEQQRVEILKALIRGAKLLILDEPTGVLTPQEAERLFTVMDAMKREGHALVFITHKLHEVMRAADRITVLRKGEVVGSMPRAEATPPLLTRLMVGRDVSFERVPLTLEPGEVLLRTEGLMVKSDRGALALKGVDLELRRGEILGVAGVAGNGQRELIETLTGLRKPESGTLKLFLKDDEKDLRRLGVLGHYEAGVAHIPEERLGIGVVPALSVSDNLSLRHYRYPPFSRSGLLNPAAMQRFAREAVERYRIATPSIHAPVRNLSGGNIQKLILARELEGEPVLIVAAHPTYGLDVGATELTHRVLAEQRERGAGILLVSEDLDELLRLSNRIAVLFAGEIMGVVDAEEADFETLGRMMVGERL
jgi:simple sugar transport system ATP-binding protein